jgi:hypothetical protein
MDEGISSYLRQFETAIQGIQEQPNRTAECNCSLSSSKLHDDSDQCNAIIGSYLEDQSLHMTKDMRTKDAALKRAQSRLADTKKMNHRDEQQGIAGIFRMAT